MTVPWKSYFPTDKTLLRVFLVAVIASSVSVFLVYLSIEDVATTSNETPVEPLPNFRNQLQKQMSPTAMVNVERADHEPRISSNASTATSKSEIAAAEIAKPFFHTHNSPYHVVFSSGCSTFQDWQSYVFFYHVMHSGQEGHVSRIASGCAGQEEQDLRRIFADEIESMAPGRHHLHLTPDFSEVSSNRSKAKNQRPFKYYNKPFGMRHWMQHALGYPENHALHDDSIIILLDPDQIMLRPFTNDFSSSSEVWKLKEGYKLKVEHGSPFSQQYGYGVQWLSKVDPKYVFDGQTTPVANMTRKEAMDYYMAMGPPYIATARDMWSIVTTWSDIVPRVHDEYPFLLAEMFGFNLAVSHLGLRHTIAHSFMVSDPWAGGEGWPLLSNVTNKDACHSVPPSVYPHVLHYCQRYYLGKWFIGKYKLRKDFISCEAPLLKIPPADIALKYQSAITPGDKERKDIKAKQVKYYAFMVCAMIDALNSAAKYYKDHHCDSRSANYNYTYTFHKDMRMPEEIT